MPGNDPYTDPPGTHRHACRVCGLVWTHPDAGRCEHPAGAHDCPACGALGLFKYLGDCPPDTHHPPKESYRGSMA